jgi:hypothetical protein
MEKTRTVVLYGNSLVISSIAASLASQPGLTLHQLDASLPDLARQVKLLDADALIFDLAAAHPDTALELLREHPRLLLIGVDVRNAKMLMLSGQQSQALTMDDLTRALKAHFVLTARVDGDDPAPGIERRAHLPGSD